MKQKQLFGLFEKVDGKWVRLFPTLQYPRWVAVQMFQSALLASAMGQNPSGRKRSLRKVADAHPLYPRVVE